MPKTLVRSGALAISLGVFMASAAPKPKLILQVTVDQLRGDLPERFMHNVPEGGFHYLKANGLWYANALHGHDNTETVVGHTTLATGAAPSEHGMVSNVWFDRNTGKLSHNVEDENHLTFSPAGDALMLDFAKTVIQGGQLGQDNVTDFLAVSFLDHRLCGTPFHSTTCQQSRMRMAVMTGTDEEIRKINGWQDQITVTPMSEWLANGEKGTPQAKSKVIPGDYKVYPRMAEIAKGQVDKQTSEDFFSILNLSINDPSMSLMTDSLKEHEMLKSLEAFGIGKGKDFKWSDLDKETQAALIAGFKAGFKQVRDALKGNLIDLNGWGAVRNAGDLKPDGPTALSWLMRAGPAPIATSRMERPSCSWTMRTNRLMDQTIIR